MAQPSSLTKTFDTSLVDVQRSFSSTETDMSGSSVKENAPPAERVAQREPSPYRTVPTDILYNQWASTYDTDGNVLQATDDIQLHDLLPEFARLSNQNQPSTGGRDGVLRILDLGCGTGRNTVKLLQLDWGADVDISGWDSSSAMLEVAKKKCETGLEQRKGNVGIELEQVDIASTENVPDRFSSSFDGLISTLVLEHIPIETFFTIVARVLKSGSYALITNMHEEMGARSRAGYKTASGERFKATSYIYTVAETAQAAKAVGLEVVQPAREIAVDERMINGGVVNGVEVPKGQVAERARKWIGTKIWFGMMLRKP